MRKLRSVVAPFLALAMSLPTPTWAANHREAPITALDPKADITDVFAFRSYGPGSSDKITLIMCVDPFLEPSNGPNWFPFDPGILYEIKIDNNNDAVADLSFQFRFTTEQRLPDLFTVYAGVPGGAKAPANSPAPVAPGTALVPDQIKTFSDAGLGQRQSYTVTMVKNPQSTATGSNNAGGNSGNNNTSLTGSSPLYAVPANVGPRTMDYNALFNAGINSLGNGVRVFAGTVDDPFWIDLGGAFDTLNTHVPPVLDASQDAANMNFASDSVSGYAVNAIAIEVPISMLTSTGKVEAATSVNATIGVWATTSRPRVTVRRTNAGDPNDNTFVQIQRMGNPLINELIIGTGSKDKFSMEDPKNDSQFATFALDPTLARVVNALTNGAVQIPPPPRRDLLPLVTYAPPIAAPGTPAGPVADLLRLNTGVPATNPATASRLGALAGDLGGFPNGRRLMDDVTDIALRVVVGGVLAGPPYSTSSVNTSLGDGVNVNDVPYRTDFPYLANAPSGRDRRHVDPGEAQCSMNGGFACAK